MRSRLFTAFAFLLVASAANAAQQTDADRQWLGRCAAQLAGEGHSPRSVQVYCACMHGMFEDNAPVRQVEMERMFPPVHLRCRKQAGWK